MGNVAIGAAAYLVEKLGAQRMGVLAPGDHFDVKRVEVKNGIAQRGRFPRSTFYGWRDPAGNRDLLIFVGEAQPSERGFEFANRLLDRAQGFGIQRVFTFAAMATPIHPSGDPRVFAVATGDALLDEVRRDGAGRERAHVLKEGEITGLNGVLLAAAMERGIESVCLLGELPFFAIGVPNPKASLAVLRIFEAASGIPVDLTDLEGQSKAVERGLITLLERMQAAARRARASAADDDEDAGFSVPSFVASEAEHVEGGGEEDGDDGPQLDGRVRRRLERLFARAREDRTQALELKAELDRLGVFKDYEDRFLDLFKQGG
jgi:proteasome assembly chaperone (PAC2) family protein